MIRNKHAIIWSLMVMLSVLMTRCSVKKKVISEEPKMPVLVDTVSETAMDYLKYSLAFHTFSGKADAYYQDDKQEQSLKVTIKMEVDKATYLSAQALGGLVEAVSALATPDSLMALDRINRKKYLMTYEGGLALIKVPIPYASLQQLFMGNPLQPVSKVASFERRQDEAIIILRDGSQEVTLYYDARDKRLLRQQVSDITQAFSAMITYTDYQLVNNGKSFAMNHDIHILKGTSKARVILEYQRVDIDLPVEYRFSIPKSYQMGRVDR